jgi:hypothetical protein
MLSDKKKIMDLIDECLKKIEDRNEDAMRRAVAHKIATVLGEWVIVEWPSIVPMGGNLQV